MGGKFISRKKRGLALSDRLHFSMPSKVFRPPKDCRQALFVLVSWILQSHPYSSYGDQAVTNPVKNKSLFAQQFDESQLEGYGLQPNLPLSGDHTAKQDIIKPGVCQGKNSQASMDQLHHLM